MPYHIDHYRVKRTTYCRLPTPNTGTTVWTCQVRAQRRRRLCPLEQPIASLGLPSGHGRRAPPVSPSSSGVSSWAGKPDQYFGHMVRIPAKLTDESDDVDRVVSCGAWCSDFS